MAYKKYLTKLAIVKSHKDAKLPTQEKDDIGFDIFSVEDVEIESQSVGKINTGLQFSVNPHYPKLLSTTTNVCDVYDDRWSLETKIEGRSGMASRGIFPVGGEIDPRYRGDIIVCLFNSTKEIYKIKKGDKIAQLVIRPVLANTKNHEVNFIFVDKQEETDRGNKGFGSSGK